VHPTLIHQWKRALLEGASGVFERGGKKTTEVDEALVKELHAKIGELAVANDFLSRKLKPWGGT
jgi:transposase